MGQEWVGIGIKDTKKAEQIKSLCKKLNVQTRQLQSQDYHRTVSEVAGLGAVKKTNQEVRMPIGYVPQEMLLFSGFTNERLDAFLNNYREAQIEPVALKATVTLYNIGWSLYALEQELRKEHEEMQARKQ